MVSIAGSTPLGIAQGLAAQGLQVLPARFRDKAPIVDWKKYQDVRSEPMLAQWFGASARRNYWILTGRQSGVIVVDCDNPAADAWWRAQIGDDLMDATAQVVTRKGRHYWFRLPVGWDKPIASWSVHEEDGLDFDVRADGGGVIAPPSVHESGHQYVWAEDRTLAAALEAPAGLLDGTFKERAPGTASVARGTGKKGTGGQVRSLLSNLLSKGPEDSAGRNVWLASVCGHYARTYHNHEDLYRAHCEQANAGLPDPLDDAERDKTIDSIWRGEHERNPERALDATCGWLKSGGESLYTQVMTRADKDAPPEYEMAEWANFDLVAKGVMLAEDGGRTYWVQVVRRGLRTGTRETLDLVLDARVLGDDKRLRAWLAGYACTILPPINTYPKEGTPGQRLQRYLESQTPAEVKVTRTLGWDDDILDGQGGFVTHDGVITPGGLLTAEESGVRPDPHLLVGGQAPHRYGYDGDLEQAREVLREVLTFHHDEVVSVFGAWWAACLVKAQIEQRTSLFPFMAIEAPSESGKTNGYFDQMTQLNGNTRGETAPTKAALRDMAAAHRNGIVWVDDLDDPAYLMELLRAATSGGSLTKMGEDRESVVNTKIVSPIVISGEALGLGSQKALLDRAIVLPVGSPTGRKSTKGDYPQWDDVIALRERFPGGLSAVAGWLVQDALGKVEAVVDALAEGKRGAVGRVGDKYAILHAGACLLDYLSSTTEGARETSWGGSGVHARRVARWVTESQEAAPDNRENSLTLEILPWALRTFKFPDRPLAGDHARDLDAPVYVKYLDEGERPEQVTLDGEVISQGPEVWFSTALLAQAWEREKHGRVQQRTQSADALRDQADVLKAPSKQVKILGGNGRRARYRLVQGDLAKAVIRRAQGH